MSLSAWKDTLGKSIFMPFSLGIYLSLKVTSDVWNMDFMPMLHVQICTPTLCTLASKSKISPSLHTVGGKKKKKKACCIIWRQLLCSSAVPYSGWSEQTLFQSFDAELCSSSIYFSAAMKKRAYAPNLEAKQHA